MIRLSFLVQIYEFNVRIMLSDTYIEKLITFKKILCRYCHSEGKLPDLPIL